MGILNGEKKGVKKAYLAMFYFLEDEFQETKQEYLGDICSDLSPFTFVDSDSADPACYPEFEEIYEKHISQTDPAKRGYEAMLEYLNFYKDEWGYDIGEVIPRLTYERFFAYFEAEEEA